MTGVDPHAETRLAVLGAMSRALADLPALMALLAEADDEADAVRRLQETHAFSPLQARAVLDLQFSRLPRARRAALDAELRDLSWTTASTASCPSSASAWPGPNGAGSR